MLRIIPALFVFLSLFCSSCSFVVMNAYGIKSPKKLDQKQIAAQAKKYNIPTETSFELDPTFYSHYLKSFDTIQYGQQVKKPLSAFTGHVFRQNRESQSFLP
jgi:hypothetical protein